MDPVLLGLLHDDTASNEADSILKDDFDLGSQNTLAIVFRSTTATADDPAYKDAVTAALDNVKTVTAVGKELEKRDARYLGLACRIASEFGAHFVKTYYCEDFSKVVESCPVPLVVAGGPKLETELDALELAFDATQDGARGVDMGRNIWQSANPVGMIRAIRSIVHERATPKEALELVKGAKPKK